MTNKQNFQLSKPYAIIHLKTDGSYNLVPCDRRELNLGLIYKYVRDPIDIVHAGFFSAYYSGEFSDLKLIVDDEGLMRDDISINRLATLIYGSTIAGDVLLATTYNPSRCEPDVYAFDMVRCKRVWDVLIKIDDLLKKVKSDHV